MSEHKRDDDNEDEEEEEEIDEEEKYEKEIKDQAYILTKIRQYKEELRNIQSKQLITGLPLL